MPRRTLWTSLFGAIGAFVMLVVNMPYHTARSNVASWVEGLGLDQMALAIPENADLWGSAVALGFFVVAFVTAVSPRLLGSTVEQPITAGRWVLHFNPDAELSKEMTFRDDGNVGEGRNKNEWRWTLDGNDLAIWRENGDLQNRFRYEKSPRRFVFVNDARAKGIKNQYIERTD